VSLITHCEFSLAEPHDPVTRNLPDLPIVCAAAHIPSADAGFRTGIPFAAAML
jgi:hypothetical protein